MIFLSILLLIICSYSDLRNRGISVVLLAAFLTSDILLMVGVYIFGDRYELLRNSMVYELNIANVALGLLPGLVITMILGIMLGLERTFILLVLSMLLTAVFGIGCMVFKGKSRKDTLPYIPFVLGAHIIMIAVGMGSWMV